MLVTESAQIPVELSAWMNLTKTQTEIKRKITLQMENEIAGLGQTGFFPYKKNNRIYFDQRWLMMIGKKG